MANLFSKSKPKTGVSGRRKEPGPKSPDSPAAAKPAKRERKAGASPKPGDTFPIVGIGASAGGVKALEVFFSRMAPDSGLAFVVIQHFDPSAKSMMETLLSRWTRIPVRTAEDGAGVRPNHIYLKPPDHDLQIEQGRLRLIPTSETAGARMPIDTFFRSLAKDQGDRAVCVILSGGGSDGTLGLREVKGAGGLVLVQQEAGAEFKGMLSSAINTGLADFVLPIEAMPEKLIGYAAHQGDRLVPAEPATEGDRAERDFQRILTEIRTKTGHDFSRYKRNTLARRIERRLALNQIESLDAYARFLRQNRFEADELFKDLTINVTSFFRDPQAFERLGEAHLPALLREKLPGLPFRVWLAGCATGEEAYSIAISVLEAGRKNRRSPAIQVFATDLNPEAIEFARASIYPENVVLDIPPSLLRKYFIREDGHIRPAQVLRSMVVFSVHSLIKDPPFSRMDLSVCRNVLIYLENDLQRKVLALLHYSLLPNGLLFLGSAESVGERPDMFAPLDRKWKIFVKKEVDARVYNGEIFKSQAVPPAPPAGPGAEEVRRDREVRRLAERVILERFTPPGVLVDGALNVQYFHGDVGRWLNLPEGEASLDIQRLAPADLRDPVRKVVEDARRRRKPSEIKGLRVRFRPESTINLTATPLGAASRSADVVLLTFEETLPSRRTKDKEKERAGQAQPSAGDLEARLLRTEQELQATIEQLESANEELRSANEELQANNEELQSLNEEMESSKEELQSTNEELETVNEELISKNDLLARASDEMEEFFQGIDFGLIFLDNDLRIRRFNPAAAGHFNLIKGDLGRSIADLRTNLKDFDILKEARGVLDEFVRKSFEVEADGRWYCIRLSPHRTQASIRGVILNFQDITSLKRSERTAFETGRLAQGILDELPVPVAVLDAGLRVIRSNRAFREAFPDPSEVSANVPFPLLPSQRWRNTAELKAGLERLITGRRRLTDLALQGDPAGTGRSFTLAAHAIPAEDDQSGRILLIFTPVEPVETKPDVEAGSKGRGRVR